MHVLVVGSLNIDDVYSVPHIVMGGETLAATSYEVFSGGKGANQAGALAKAGLAVSLLGALGQDGEWLLEGLHRMGVNTSHIVRGSTPTGRAIIQVSQDGDNSIILFPGANLTVQPARVAEAFASLALPDPKWLLLQGEINVEASARALLLAANSGYLTCLNPAPCSPALLKGIGLDLVDVLVVNETEANDLAVYLGLQPRAAGVAEMQDLGRSMLQCCARAKILVITLGPLGAVLVTAEHCLHQAADPNLVVVDTTAAGDTFIGFFLSALSPTRAVSKEAYLQLLRDQPFLLAALKRAVKASGLCCERKGAAASIPSIDDLAVKQ